MPDNRATAIFDADDSALKRTVKEIDETLEKVEDRFKAVTETIAELFVFEKAREGAEKLTEGVEGVLEVGDKFHAMADQVGAPVDALMILDQQFKAAHLDAEKLIPSLTHMQKVLGEGTENSLITEIGVDIETLRRQNPVQQFQTLGKAIAGLENPTDRSTAAMAIFSKEGAQLLSLFKDGNSFEAAALAVGSQAEILNADAALFSDASTKLAEAGLKTQGFFVGVADEIVPTLLPLLDRFERLDAARAGQQAGQFVNAFASNQDLAGTILDSLLIDGAKFIGFIIDGFATAGHFLKDEMLGVAEAFGSEIEQHLGDAMKKAGENTPGWLGGGLLARGGQALDDSAASTRQSMHTHDNLFAWQHVGAMDSVIDSLERDLGDKVGGALSNAAGQHAAALAGHPQVTDAIGPQEFSIPIPNVGHLAAMGGAFGQEKGGMDPLIEANNLRQRQLDALHEIRDRLPVSAAGTAPHNGSRNPFPE